MALSNDLISQLIKVNKEPKKATESTCYGTTVSYEGRMYVKLDGSDVLTPINTTSSVNDGDRVTVLIKDHTATVTGNMSDPSASSNTVERQSYKISEFEGIIAYKVTTDNMEAINAYIETLRVELAKIDKLDVVKAEIDELEAYLINAEHLTATDMKVVNAQIENLEATFGKFTDVSTENLEAINAEIGRLKTYTAEFTYVSAEVLEAMRAQIKNLDVENLDAKYANIDFANIGEAAFKKIFSDSGLIKDLVVGDSTITGELVGVTIKGDLIEGNTVKADKLVIKGSDGIYYKLNFEAGSFKDGEAVPTDSLHGSIITAKSVTAEKVSVEDLVAFDATIGGFNITEHSIYSGVKENVANTTRGIYLDDDGQVAFGDSNNYVKFYKDENGKYKLDISAETLKFGARGTNLEDLQGDIIVSTVEEFYHSTSATTLSGGEWSTEQPTWTEGKYVWRRTLVTYGDDSTYYTPGENGVCITGNTGSSGVDGQMLYASCSTVAETQEKIATLESGTIALKPGVAAVVKFAYANDVSSPTLNVNDTGAYPIRLNGADITSPTQYWVDGTVITFVYDGNYWNIADASALSKANEAKDAASAANALAEDAQKKATDVASAIAVLTDRILNMVKGENGASLITQTDDGWQLDLWPMQQQINNASGSIENLDKQQEDMARDLAALQGKTEFVRMTVDENGQPCIVLGEDDSSFQVKLTNTQLQFVDGSTIPAYVSNKKLMINQAEVEDELQFGEFIWKNRPSGNMGLMWTGGENLLVNTHRFTAGTPIVMSSSSNDYHSDTFNGYMLYTPASITPGTKVTLQACTDAIWKSVHGYGNDPAAKQRVTIWVYWCTADQILTSGTYVDAQCCVGDDNATGRYTWVLNVPPATDSVSALYARIRLNIYSDGSETVTHKFWNIKMEAGESAGVWTPHVDDVSIW